MKITIIEKEECLGDIPNGSMFLYGDTLALKSEYRTEQGAIEAFIYGSGEMFWGGATTYDVQVERLVKRVIIEL